MFLIKLIKTVKGFLLSAIILLCLFSTFIHAESETFAIISDSHIGSNDSVYEEFIQAIDKQNIDVIIHCGDAIHTPGSSKQWKRFIDITGSNKTLHITPGNHDIQGNKSLNEFLRYFPELYYSHSNEDTLFIFLNSELPGEEGMITGKQLAWLKDELQKTFRYKFVFVHRPLFPIFGLHGLDKHKQQRDELHQLFAKQGVSLVVSGHDHLYNRRKMDGITYIIAAASGGQTRFLSDTRFYFRYIVGKRTQSGYYFTVKDMDGATGDEFKINNN